MFAANSGESTVADDLLEHILTRVTDEGLIVDLFDLPDAALFDPGTATATPLMETLIGVVGEVFALAGNDIAINGHVRSEAVVRSVRTEWEISTGRAHATRTLLSGAGIDTLRIERIGGYADRERLYRDPMDVRNNRVELILLR
jgi:chemotaxis protein MotB